MSDIESDVIVQRLTALDARVTGVESRLATREVLDQTIETADRVTRNIIASHSGSLERVIATQAEHTRILTEHTARFDGIEALLREVLDRLPPK